MCDGMLLSASIMAWPCARRDLALLEFKSSGVDCVHVDLMDGDGAVGLLEGVRAHTDLPIDVHVVSARPQDFLPLVDIFAPAYFSLQYVPGLVPMTQLRGSGTLLGMALGADVVLDEAADCIEEADFLLMTGATPGLSGATFDPGMSDRIGAVRRRWPEKAVHVDGGVTPAAVPVLHQLDVRLIVSGSHLARGASLGPAVQEFHSAILCLQAG